MTVKKLFHVSGLIETNNLHEATIWLEGKIFNVEVRAVKPEPLRLPVPAAMANTASLQQITGASGYPRARPARP